MSHTSKSKSQTSRVDKYSQDAIQATERFERAKSSMLAHAYAEVPEKIALDAYNFLLKQEPTLIWNDVSIIKKEFYEYLSTVFLEMFCRLKLEGRINEVFSLLAVPENAEAISDIEKQALIENEKTKSLQNYCNYMVQFLDEHDRVEIFELLLSALTKSNEMHLSSLLTGQLEPSAEKHLAKTIKVSNRIIFKWKNKQTVPNIDSTSKMLLELLRRDPSIANDRLKAILGKVQKNAFEVYSLLRAVGSIQ